MWIRRATLLALLLSQSSCTMLGYVTQAAAGQDDLNRRARDIDELIRDERVTGETRRMLALVAPIKHFGELHGLHATTNYTRYVRIDRSAEVYAVSACEPLRFRAKSWNFPFVGGFTFLNWFKRADADAFAASLAKDGWDVDVREVPAYSTAGYFADPVVSTMIPKGKHALGGFANLILHESTHSTILVPRQSMLNESIASFVGRALAREYLSETLGATAEETVAYADAERASFAQGLAMHEAHETLARIYASAESPEAKRADKARVIAALSFRIQARRPITNATLLQYETYNSGQDELAALLAACGSWPRLVGALKTLEGASFTRTQDPNVGAIITALGTRECKAANGASGVVGNVQR